ncbi:hypothetical protein [Enterovibrio calviensis]|uniref:hypothetical protein n=1 Tax=Enterovibrio calviensis TaxID=91359 RepID=UPI0037363F64
MDSCWENAAGEGLSVAALNNALPNAPSEEDTERGTGGNAGAGFVGVNRLITRAMSMGLVSEPPGSDRWRVCDDGKDDEDAGGVPAIGVPPLLDSS